MLTLHKRPRRQSPQPPPRPRPRPRQNTGQARTQPPPGQRTQQEPPRPRPRSRQNTGQARTQPPPGQRTQQEPPPQQQRSTEYSAFDQFFLGNAVWFAIAFVAIAIFLSVFIPKNNELTDPLAYLLGESIPTASQSTITSAQENYNLGMQALNQLVDGGDLKNQGKQAVEYFQQATQLDPEMTAAYRQYGLLMFEFWKDSRDEVIWENAYDALLQYKKLGGENDRDVNAALERLRDSRNNVTLCEMLEMC